jgi:hypothetical protein
MARKTIVELLAAPPSCRWTPLTTPMFLPNISFMSKPMLPALLLLSATVFS